MTQVHNTIASMIYCDVLLQGGDILYKYMCGYKLLEQSTNYSIHI
jgi:hypothetical protein